MREKDVGVYVSLLLLGAGVGACCVMYVYVLFFFDGCSSVALNADYFFFFKSVFFFSFSC